MSDAERDRLGLYAQPSYRFLERWAAFYRFDLFRLENAGRTEEHTVGINFRPIPDVSLKVEVFHSLQSKSSDFNGIATSIALAF